MASFYVDGVKNQESTDKPQSEDFEDANEIIRKGKEN